MKSNPFSTPDAIPFKPGERVSFLADEGDLPTEVSLLNEFSETISRHIGHPDLFDPYDAFKPASDLYRYMVQNYLFVLQSYLPGSQNDDTRFLILHYDFIFNHFSEAIDRKSNPGDLISETKIVLQRLYFFMRDGERSEVHPAFETQQDIVDLFIALKDLYNGDSGKYLKIMFKVL